jgi:hypothetical protein
MRRRVLSVAAAAALLTTLCGCGPVPFIAARLDSGVLAAVLCSDQRVNQVTFFATSDGKAWRQVWSVDSNSYIPRGTPIVAGDTSQGTSSGGSPAEIGNDDTQVQVHFQELDPSGTAIQDSWTTFQVADLSDKYWLSAAGSRTDSPCE